MGEITSIAVLEPLEGEEPALLAVLHELYSLLERKGYSRDTLLRSRKEPVYFINVRCWASEQARLEAHEDPDLHRCWARLGQLCRIPRVHEILDDIDWRSLTRVQ